MYYACLVSSIPFLFSRPFTLSKMQEKSTHKKITHWAWGFSSPLVSASRMQGNVLRGQIEHIVLGRLGAPDPRSSQRPDSGQNHANLTFRVPPLSIEWLCLLRAWCGVSIARCLGLRRVCSWSFYLAGILSIALLRRATFCGTGNSDSAAASSTSSFDDKPLATRSSSFHGRLAEATPSFALEYANFLDSYQR